MTKELVIKALAETNINNLYYYYYLLCKSLPDTLENRTTFNSEYLKVRHPMIEVVLDQAFLPIVVLKLKKHYNILEVYTKEGAFICYS